MLLVLVFVNVILECETGPWLGRKWSRTWAKMMKNHARITLKKQNRQTTTTKHHNNKNNKKQAKTKQKQKTKSRFPLSLSLASFSSNTSTHDRSHVISINRGA